MLVRCEPGGVGYTPRMTKPSEGSTTGVEMTGCSWVEGCERTSGKSCTITVITLDGVSFPRRRWDETAMLYFEGACVCGVPQGGFHHPGCTKEDCPKCGEQLFCCSCKKGDGLYEEED